VRGIYWIVPSDSSLISKIPNEPVTGKSIGLKIVPLPTIKCLTGAIPRTLAEQFVRMLFWLFDLSITKVFSAQHLMQGCFSLNTVTILLLITISCIGVTKRKEN